MSSDECGQTFCESKQRQFGISIGTYVCMKAIDHGGDHRGRLVSVASYDDPISVPAPSRTEGADQ